MKKNILIFLLINIFFSCYSQAPAKFNYQGVARNPQGQVIANQNIALKVSILDIEINGSSIYSETHSAKTNQLGLFNIAIGGGTVLSGDFNKIPWSQKDKFVKIEMDPAGGFNYTLIGTSQLLSVPYALHSKTAEKVDLVAQNSYQDDNLIITEIYKEWISSPQKIVVESDGKYLLSATGRAWCSWSSAVIMRIQNITNDITLGRSIITSVNIQGVHQGDGSFSRIVNLKKGDELVMQYYGDANSQWAYGGDQFGSSSMTILKLSE